MGGIVEHMTSEAKEQVQVIVWAIEAVTLLTAVAIAGIVWRVSRRARDARKSEQVD